MKNTSDGFIISRPDTAAERINELEDISTESFQTEMQRKIIRECPRNVRQFQMGNTEGNEIFSDKFQKKQREYRADETCKSSNSQEYSIINDSQTTDSGSSEKTNQDKH